MAVVSMLAVALTATSAAAAVPELTVKTDPASPTTLKISWTAVADAATYQVQYSTDSAIKKSVTTKANLTGTETSLTGLGTGKTYYVHVAAVDAKKKVGTYSKTVSGKPAYPYAAPGDLFRTKVNKSSMTVSWKAVSGAPGYTVRAYAKGAPTLYKSTTGTSVTFTGMKASTTYYLRAFVEKAKTDTTAAVVLSANSPEVTTATTSYTLATPDNLREGDQNPTSVVVSWDPVANGVSTNRYVVEYGLDAAITDHRKVTGRTGETTIKLIGLDNDTTYFAKVYVVDEDGKRITPSSDFIVAKSLVPRGSIRGTVGGVSGNDVVAVAYDKNGNAARQVKVGSDGGYSIPVRPGSYKVQILYVGTGNYASAYAQTNGDGGWVYSQGSALTVSTGQETSAPKVEIKKGHVVSGTVLDPSGNPVRDVDITAISGEGSEREVITMTRSGTDGKFKVQGLSSGKYWFRYIYSGDGFQTLSRSLDVDDDLGVKVNLENDDFRTRYLAYIQGNRRVGSTINVYATAWLAGDYPTTRATLSYQWKRNGSPISGATGKKYKLGSADRGKSITITVTARRYGYNTGTTTSKPAKIS